MKEAILKLLKAVRAQFVVFVLGFSSGFVSCTLHHKCPSSDIEQVIEDVLNKRDGLEIDITPHSEKK